MANGQNARKYGSSRNIEDGIAIRNRRQAEERHARFEIEIGLEDAPKVGQLVVAQGRSVEVIELYPTRTIRRRIFVPSQTEEYDLSAEPRYKTSRRRRNRGFYKRHHIYLCRVLYKSFDALVRFEQAHRSRLRRWESYWH